MASKSIPDCQKFPSSHPSLRGSTIQTPSSPCAQPWHQSSSLPLYPLKCHFYECFLKMVTFPFPTSCLILSTFHHLTLSHISTPQQSPPNMQTPVAYNLSPPTALLQGIFPTQGSNPCLPHCRWIFFLLSEPPGKLLECKDHEIFCNDLLIAILLGPVQCLAQNTCQIFLLNELERPSLPESGNLHFCVSSLGPTTGEYHTHKVKKLQNEEKGRLLVLFHCYTESLSDRPMKGIFNSPWDCTFVIPFTVHQGSDAMKLNCDYQIFILQKLNDFCAEKNNSKDYTFIALYKTNLYLPGNLFFFSFLHCL